MPRLVLFCMIILFTNRGLSQQNLFNVPSSEITEKGHPFFQQQLNFSRGIVQSNTTFDFGLGRGMEAGVNILSVNASTDNSGDFLITNTDTENYPVYPFYSVNFQKGFHFNDRLKAAIGTQTGLANGGTVGSYTWSNVVARPWPKGPRFIAGVYWASNSMFGPGERSRLIQGSSIGTQLGIEQPMFHDRLFLIAENISGTHTLGETSLGAAFRFTGHWLISAAWQFPNSGSSSLEALVIELTYAFRGEK